MKIVIASGIFIPELGGPATYVPNISEEFIKLGHKVSVLTYSDSEKYDFDSSLLYPVFRVKRGNKLLNYLKYYRKLGEIAKDADIIYAFDHFSAGLPAVIFAKIYKKPLYIRVGGDFIWERYVDASGDLVTLREFYEKGVYKKSERLRFEIIKKIFSSTKGIIFTTNFQKEIFAKFYQIAKEKTAIVQNPVLQSKNNLPKNNNSKEIIFAGRFINKNNILNLVKAFEKIDDKNYSLVLIGEGPLENKIKETISGLNLKNIFVEKKLSREELRQRFAGAYLAVFPSLTDISPNSMLECLTTNTPFIASQEIGFDWLKDKIISFDPKNVAEMTEKINYLLLEKNYLDYYDRLSSLEYHYDYHQAASDTLGIFQ